MSYSRLIIDGYSLIHRDPELKAIVAENLQRAREELIAKVSRTATAMADKVTIVFDGQGHTGRGVNDIHAIEIIYSPLGQTADTVIERLVGQAEKPVTWLVVTNDRRERETVMATGVQTMSCAVFLEECLRMQRNHAHSMQRRKAQNPGPKLGDFFPGS